MKLSVYVATYCHRSVDELDVGFFDEEFPGFVAKLSDLGFRDWFASAELFNCTRGGEGGLVGSKRGGGLSEGEGWGRRGGMRVHTDLDHSWRSVDSGVEPRLTRGWCLGRGAQAE